jgi:L-ascorbate metabolism protein UlaG (beta-lactamase superfamily)
MKQFFWYTVRIMVITYLGGECFKVSFGNTTLAFNPISKDSSQTAVKFGADVAFITTNHEDMNGVAQVTYGEREPFVVQGPGEYEVGEVTARGYGVKTRYDGADIYNTVYYVTLEGINMLFCGVMSDPKLDSKILEEFGDIDILFVPVGGGDVMDASAAAQLAVKLEARVIIPMHYDASSLKLFLKESGAEGVKAEEKLTVKKKDLLTLEGQVVVLKS